MTTETNSGTQAGPEVAQDTTSTTPAPSSAIRFEDLGLSADVLKAVTESGYTTPTPIQAQGIPEVLKRRDIIGIAQTGTGKTASFTLPMIEMLARGRAKARMPRSLILEPTRELAAQVSESFERYGKYNKLSMALLIGGTSFDDQDKKLDRGVDVLIATPGRLLDHFERGKLMLSQVQILVIDEADRMLDMGFIPDVERICKLIPFTRQTLFYSATMPPEIRRLTDQFLHNAVRVEVTRPAMTAENIKQEIVQVPANDWAKRETLRRLIRENEVKNAIVFCNRKRDVDVVAKSLQNARLLRGTPPWRSRPVAAHAHPGIVSGRRYPAARRQRRGRARSRHSARQPHLQLRRSLSSRRLRPPHRPHGPRRPRRSCADAGDAEGFPAGRSDREPHQASHCAAHDGKS